jgi:hypothetical protein
METKKFTQSGTLAIVLFLPLMIFFTIMFFSSGFESIGESIALGFIILSMLICLLIFYKLAIYIDDSSVSFKMGIGLIHKKYLLTDIASCRPTKNPYMYGVGIRMTPDGWLYNVSGLSVIELTFKNKKSKIRIGTDKPEEISQVINKLINNQDYGFVNSDTKKSHYIAFWTILISTLIVPVILILTGNHEIRIDATGSDFRIVSMYGVTINYSDIRQLDTISSLPDIRLKTNGYAFGKILKGNFMTRDGAKVKLFIKKENPPYIFINTGEMKIYMNFEDPDKTTECFGELTNRFNSLEK